MSTAERRNREKARRQREILAAARRVVFSKGIHRATVDDVAAAAELSKGAIYLYFESKESILAHLLLEGLQRLLQDLQSAYAPQEPLAAAERIRRLARAYLRFAQEHPDEFRLLMALDRGGFRERVSPELYERVLTESLRGLELVTEAVRQGLADGHFFTESPRQTAGALWAALHGVLMLMGHSLRRQMLSMELEPMFEATLELQLRGLLRQPSAT
ncbi:MAG TPA: TetR/AcrR family transcriptional regulator [Anaerolineae bacterium]|nr:TetR/AcrR family transcriptional regulator [Anaerolineae bacterium]